MVQSLSTMSKNFAWVVGHRSSVDEALDIVACQARLTFNQLYALLFEYNADILVHYNKAIGMNGLQSRFASIFGKKHLRNDPGAQELIKVTHDQLVAVMEFRAKLSIAQKTRADSDVRMVLVDAREILGFNIRICDNADAFEVRSFCPQVDLTPTPALLDKVGKNTRTLDKDWDPRLSAVLKQYLGGYTAHDAETDLMEIVSLEIGQTQGCVQVASHGPSKLTRRSKKAI